MQRSSCIAVLIQVAAKLALAALLALFHAQYSAANTCGNSENFHRWDAAYAGDPQHSESAFMLRASTKTLSSGGQAVYSAPIYSGTAYLDAPLKHSLLLDYDYQPSLTDLKKTRTQEAWINVGETVDGEWEASQEGYFDFDFHVYQASLFYDDETWDNFEILVNTEMEKSDAEPLIQTVLNLLDEMAVGAVLEMETLVLHPGNGRATAGVYSNTMTLYPNTINEPTPNLLGILYHEIAHIAVDEHVADTSSWRSAQQSDNAFLSEYGEENPDREDVAETWPVWVRLTYFGDYATVATTGKITNQIPNRLEFFDNFSWGDEEYFYQPFGFRFDSEEAFVKASLEEPVDGGIQSGISNLRGWAVASSGVTRVAVYIDGKYAFEAPYGGSRGDVGAAFPEGKDSSQSGFGMAFNYGSLTEGRHTMTIRAYANDGTSIDSSSSFDVAPFHTPFIGPSSEVKLDSSSISTNGDEITIRNANIADVIYDLTLKWSTPGQAFQVISTDR